MPTLVLDGGEALIDSATIPDYLDTRVGPARALLPATGRERRDALPEFTSTRTAYSAPSMADH